MLHVVYMENFSRPEEGDDNCRKMTHMGMMDKGFTACKKQFKSKFKNYI